MQQYFIESKLSEKILFNEEQSHHIAHVMRMKEGEIVKVVDCEEQAAYAAIHYEGKKAVGLLQEHLPDDHHKQIDISLAMALVKKEKWELCIQKSAECGAYDILPFISSRSVVKISEEKNDKKLARWQKIALEACEQSKQNHRCLVHPICSFSQVLEKEADLKCIAYENADTTADSLGKVLCQHLHIRSVLVMIGPEGGFSGEEIAEAKAHGFICVSLGKRILRAETAAISAVSMLTYHYELLGEWYGTNKENSEKG